MVVFNAADFTWYDTFFSEKEHIDCIGSNKDKEGEFHILSATAVSLGSVPRLHGSRSM